MSEGVCKSVGLLLGAHLDGQLDAVKTLEVEEHVASCETCRERTALDRALRSSLKKAVQTTTPDDVRARMLAAMTGETMREVRAEEKIAAAKRPAMLRNWRTMLPLASAAAFALAWGAASNQPVLSTHGSSDVMRAGFGNDDLLTDLVHAHSKAYPPEQRDPSEMSGMSQYVGVPVRVPQFKNAHFVGGRLVTLHGGEAAAMLQYVTTVSAAGQARKEAPQRVTIFVYDPRNVQITSAHLAPRAVGTAEANVGQANGYSVAVTQHRGVGYTIASDLDSDANTDLVATVDKD